MSFTTRLTPDSGYQTLLAAVARGRDVPRAWLDRARRAEQHQAEEATAAAQVAADLEAAHTANTARIKAREDKGLLSQRSPLRQPLAANGGSPCQY